MVTPNFYMNFIIFNEAVLYKYFVSKLRSKMPVLGINIVKKHYIILSSSFFSSHHIEHSLRTQFFWPSYNTRYILNWPKYICILNIFCSYSKASFKFYQSENFVADSHFYILLFFYWDSIYKGNFKIINLSSW